MSLSPYFADRLEIAGRLGDGCGGVVYLVRAKVSYFPRDLECRGLSPDAVRVRRKRVSSESNDVQIQAGTYYALKILRNTKVESEDSLVRGERHVREVNLGFTVSPHPNVVTYFDLNTMCHATETVLEILMERCDETLEVFVREKRAKEGGALRAADVLQMVNQMLCALIHFNALRVLHRDLKADNILVKKISKPGDGTCEVVLKIIDFDRGAPLKEGVNLKFSDGGGSRLFAPPENTVSRLFAFKSDVWAVALVAVEMLLPQALDVYEKNLGASLALLVPNHLYRAAAAPRNIAQREDMQLELIRKALDVPEMQTLQTECLSLFHFFNSVLVPLDVRPSAREVVERLHLFPLPDEESDSPLSNDKETRQRSLSSPQGMFSPRSFLISLANRDVIQRECFGTLYALLEKGQNVAVIGEHGAGKTVLVSHCVQKLMCNKKFFVDLWDGTSPSTLLSSAGACAYNEFNRVPPEQSLIRDVLHLLRQAHPSTVLIIDNFDPQPYGAQFTEVWKSLTERQGRNNSNENEPAPPINEGTLTTTTTKELPLRRSEHKRFDLVILLTHTRRTVDLLSEHNSPPLASIAIESLTDAEVGHVFQSVIINDDSTPGVHLTDANKAEFCAISRAHCGNLAYLVRRLAVDMQETITLDGSFESWSHSIQRDFHPQNVFIPLAGDNTDPYTQTWCDIHERLVHALPEPIGTRSANLNVSLYDKLMRVCKILSSTECPISYVKALASPRVTKLLIDELHSRQLIPTTSYHSDSVIILHQRMFSMLCCSMEDFLQALDILKGERELHTWQRKERWLKHFTSLWDYMEKCSNQTRRPYTEAITSNVDLLTLAFEFGTRVPLVGRPVIQRVIAALTSPPSSPLGDIRQGKRDAIVGYYYLQNGQYSDALGLLKNALQIFHTHQSTNDEIRVREYLGLYYYDVGRYAESNTELQGALEQVHAQLASTQKDEDLVVARLMNSMGRTYWKLGNVTEATAMFEQTLRLRLALLRPASPNGRSGSPGSSNNNNNNSAHAVPEGSTNSGTLGMHLLSTHSSINSVGTDTRDCEQEKTASGVSSSAQESNNNNNNNNSSPTVAGLSPTTVPALLPFQCHPDIATTLNCLGGVYRDQHLHDTAFRYYVLALEMRLCLLPRIHPEIAICCNNIGAVVSDVPSFYCREAKGLRLHAFQDLLCFQQSTDHNPSLNPAPPPTSLDAESLEEAANWFRIALHIQRQVLPALHSDIASGTFNLACVCEDLGRPPGSRSEQLLAEAERLFQEAERIATLLIPGNHPDIVKLLLRICLFYQRSGNVQQAAAYQIRAVNMQQRLNPT